MAEEVCDCKKFRPPALRRTEKRDEMKKKYKTDKPEEMGKRMSPEDKAAARNHIDNFDYLMKSLEEDVKPLLPSCKIILTRK